MAEVEARVELRLPQEMLDRVDAVAAAGRRSEFIRAAIDRELSLSDDDIVKLWMVGDLTDLLGQVEQVRGSKTVAEFVRNAVERKIHQARMASRGDAFVAPEFEGAVTTGAKLGRGERNGS